MRVSLRSAVAVSLCAVLWQQGSGAIAAESTMQKYPARPIRLVVPQNPGGGTDLWGRIAATAISQRLGQSVVVDNRPGAGSLIGTDLVAKAVPDGYTLLTISSALVIIPAVYKNVPFDPVRDFAPIALLSTYPHVVVVYPGLPANSIKELIALAKAKPGALNFASAGNGTPTQLGAELFKTMAGIDMVHVPFSGGGPASIALMGGQVQINFATLGAVLPQIRSGKLKALAVTTLTRSAALPELPTVAESGLPGFEQVGWNGLLAPARTPPAIIQTLHGEVTAFFQQPAVSKRLMSEGAEPGTLSPAAFSALLKSETAKWAKVIQLAGIKPE